jgi:hypothetical protein
LFGALPSGASPPYPLSWAGLSPDGTYALTNAVWMGSSTDDKTELYRMGAGGAGAAGVPTPVADAGLGADLVGATPVFSPDGAHAAFTHVSGTVGALTGDGTHVVALDFASGANGANGASGGPSFSNPKNVFTIPAAATTCVGFRRFSRRTTRSSCSSSSWVVATATKTEILRSGNTWEPRDSRIPRARRSLPRSGGPTSPRAPSTAWTR